MEFSEIDILQIEEKGLSTQEVERQIQIFERGNIKVDIQKAATVGNGIFAYSVEDQKKYIQTFEDQKEHLDLLKFVPASGAATRMFKAFHNFANEFDPGNEGLRDYLDRKEDKSLQLFFEKMDKLPFYETAFKKANENHPDFSEKSNDERQLILVKTMLYENGLGLSDLPKGLVPFHRYSDYTATAFEEHLHSAAKYLSVNGVTKLHFTVAEGDKEKFEKEFENIKERVEEAHDTKFDISYSYQDPKTDTIAVDKENDPFRDEDNRIFFRPGGHGALIENLNKQESDLIFVKNIDNVVVNTNLPKVVEMKKMLGGKLIALQNQVFEYMQNLDGGNNSEAKLDEIAEFLENELFVKVTSSFNKFTGEEKTQYLCKKLDRPLRVCGMVMNEGEPGGGPFLIKNEDGEISLQIIEGAQIDKNNSEQLEILNNSTHFNPVDIVCSLKNHKGESFDLHNYVDKNMSFIADKTKDGKPLKALERPGLWNGGMAYWNTVFVEVPVETFNPVKTVADLLKPSHQTK
ncbi:NAD metabolism ATPase/kinase [Salegentibacter salinarum]|uniref:NAD metabolism ATPase/kinase n=1 Tax=Salegentibacter salinarum TaxID=447422 RepID=A0A2N0U4T8_9FLAO|nr:DUF4301 family protein [Salegentibacter salinarum]PKD21898.1 NAD metabolism ATPase/kinase [Salegentibacter salinarum]SKB32285.1 protein of unknown function [Salegentibacter salinarum]